MYSAVGQSKHNPNRPELLATKERTIRRADCHVACVCQRASNGNVVDPRSGIRDWVIAELLRNPSSRWGDDASPTALVYEGNAARDAHRSRRWKGSPPPGNGEIKCRVIYG